MGKYYWVDERENIRQITRWSGAGRYPLNTARSREERVIELVDHWGGYGVYVDNYGVGHRFYP
jgi:hypothetical protein